jgi:hypothetical protein
MNALKARIRDIPRENRDMPSCLSPVMNRPLDTQTRKPGWIEEQQR